MLGKLQKLTFLAYMFSINFEMYDPTGMGMFSLAKIFGLIYLLSILPNIQVFIVNKGIRAIINTIFILFLFITINSIFNINSYSSYFLQSGFFLNILFFMILTNHERKSPGLFNKGLIAFSISATLTSLLSILGIGTEISEDGRLSLFGDNENYLAIRWAVAFIILSYFTLNYLKEKKYLKSIVFLFQLPLIFLAIVSTGSRVALFSLVLSMGLSIVILNYKNIFFRIITIVISLFVFQYIYNYIEQTEVMSRRLDKTFEQQNLGGREEIWSSVIPLISENAALGVGISGYQKYSLKNFGKIRSPHNVILELLAYGGVVGLGIFLYFLYQLLSISIRHYFRSQSSLSLILFVPVFGLLLSGQVLDVKIAWIIMAYSASRLFLLKNHSFENPLLYR